MSQNVRLARPSTIQPRRSILRGGLTTSVSSAQLYDGGGVDDSEETTSQAPAVATSIDTAALHQSITRAVSLACSPSSPPGTYKLIFKSGGAYEVLTESGKCALLRTRHCALV